MNVSRYISQKIAGSDSGSFTSSVTKIAIISIALGLAVMLVSFAILEGFRNEIQAKIFSFGAHLTVSKYDNNNSLEVEPINGVDLSRDLRRFPQVQAMQPFARKTAIIKTQDEVMGVVLKGIDEENGPSPMRENLLQGQFLTFPDSSASDRVLLSRKMADKLRLKVGDDAIFYFIQNPPRVRRFVVTGIYQTGLDEFDEVYVIGDIRQIRELNSWPDSLVGGYEVVLRDFRTLDPVYDELLNSLRYDLKLDKITDQYAQLFDWLQLLNRNVIIFLILIIFVATFNMVATIFIMILERTNMIGVLKALGATDNQIRRMFFFRGLNLTVKGMLWGNLVGLGFCTIQYFLHPIPLDPENYYMDRVPIFWDPSVIFIINLAVFVTSQLAVLIPTYLIARIKPVVAIKFD